MSARKSSDPLANAISAIRETRAIDFKSSFDPKSTGDWCELLKDLMAFANSGGGIIVVGEDNKGVPCGANVADLLKVDPADFGNKIRSYTNVDFDDFDVIPYEKEGRQIALIRIRAAPTPIVPTRPGLYEKSPQKTHSAFHAGVVYVRHGAKSEPATTADLQRLIERRISLVRREWMGNVRQVTAAPVGSVVTVSPPDPPSGRQAAPLTKTVQLIVDPSGTPTSVPDFDRTHPHRMTELLKIVNTQLQEAGLRIGQGDVRTILSVYSQPNDLSFTWMPKHGTRMYTDALAEFIVGKMKEDKYFALKAKNRAKRIRETRRLSAFIPAALKRTNGEQDG